MYLALLVLLVGGVLSLIGLVVLWCAASPVPWIWRLMPVLCVAGLMVPVATVELSLLLAGASGTVALLAPLLRGKSPMASFRESIRQWNFSSRDLLLATLVVSLALTIVLAMQDQFRGVQVVKHCEQGLLWGITVLGTGQLVLRKASRFSRLLVAAASLLIPAYIRLEESWFVLSGLSTLERSVANLLIPTYASFLMLMTLLGVRYLGQGFGFASGVKLEGRERFSSVWAVGLVLGNLCLILTPCLYVYPKLLAEAVSPREAPPRTANQESLVAAAISVSSKLPTTPRPDDRIIDRFLDHAAEELNLASVALAGIDEDERLWSPLDVRNEGVSLYELAALRGLSRGWRFQAQRHLRRGQPNRAIDVYEVTIRLCRLLANGGRFQHYSAACDCEQKLFGDAVRSRSLFSQEELRRLITLLGGLEQRHAIVDYIARCESHVAEMRFGWQYRIRRALGGVLREPPKASLQLWDMQQQNVAILRLAVSEFALTAYELEHGELPQSLDGLVPDYLTEVPFDPYSDQPLQYRTKGSQYIVYSVWKNKSDDGGQRPVNAGSPSPYDGDLSFASDLKISTQVPIPRRGRVVSE